MNCLDISAIAPSFLDRMEKFAAILARWGAKMNLTAHPEDPEEIAFHIIDSLAPLVLDSEPAGYHPRESFAHGRRVLDVGSGAGFPGLVLAGASDAAFTLCEARRKRVTFLNVAIAETGLANVTVEPKYLSPADLDGDFDLVTSRALGPPAEFYRIAAAALRKGGIAILYANPEQRLERRRCPFRRSRRGATHSVRAAAGANERQARPDTLAEDVKAAPNRAVTFVARCRFDFAPHQSVYFTLRG